jgi:ribosomal protein S18 acetylase RimI-like enzyme
MRIERTVIADIPEVEKIYSEARAYQFQQSGYAWPVFSKSFIEKEIIDKRHFKVLDKDDEMAGVFSIVKAEPIIWNDKDGKEAIYLHRMAIRNRYRGKNIAKKVVDWAMIEAWKNKKKFIRIDTWANNEALTGYYQKLGFERVGKRQLPPQSDLPEHYNNIEVNLFEMKLKNFF